MDLRAPASRVGPTYVTPSARGTGPHPDGARRPESDCPADPGTPGPVAHPDRPAPTTPATSGAAAAPATPGGAPAAALARVLGALWQGLATLLWPGEITCTLCGRPAAASGAGAALPGPVPEAALLSAAPTDDPICPGCLSEFAFPAGLPLCPNCSRPLDGPWALCPDCAAGAPAFTQVAALGLYRPPLSRAIVLLKYHRRRGLARPLGQALAGPVAARWGPAPFNAVVPVPLHPGRRRERGYNQAEELARPLARALCRPLRPEWLHRAVDTPPQAQQSREARARNLHGAFIARGVPWGARILLVDDVLTTGATASAAARALLRAGALRVDLAVLAVSPRPVW